MKLNSSLTVILLVLLMTHSLTSNAATKSLSNASALKVVGQAQMRWLMFPLYRVTLKTADGRYQENRYPQMLDILYLRNIDKQDLLTATDGEWKRLGVSLTQRQQWIKQLSNLWPSIKRGDKLAIQVGPEGENHFIYNDKKIGGIADKQFGPAFLAIWLSPKTSRPGIRQRLLAGV